MERVVAHQQHLSPLPQHDGKRRVEVGGAAELDADQRHARRRSCQLQLGEHVEGSPVVRIDEIGDALHRGDRLTQELQPLGAEVGTKHGIAGDVAARAGEARHQAGAHRIGDADHHDRDRRGRRLGHRRCEAGSFQFSQMPAMPKGVPSFMAMA